MKLFWWSKKEVFTLYTFLNDFESPFIFDFKDPLNKHFDIPYSLGKSDNLLGDKQKL